MSLVGNQNYSDGSVSLQFALARWQLPVGQPYQQLYEILKSQKSCYEINANIPQKK
jgi:hypothetical protein